MNAELSEIKNGYTFDPEKDIYECLICGEKFNVGEIYPVGTRFFDAGKAIGRHIESVHGSVLEYLLKTDRKITGLTDRQIEMIGYFSAGLTDNEIGIKTATTSATVRHTRFILREKAKQAKIFLAVVELTESVWNRNKNNDLVDVHAGATMIDERYEVTNEEQDAIIRKYFDLEPLTLKEFPVKQKRKLAILRRIASEFEAGRKYGEPQVNTILKAIYPDYVTIRRYLIEYGFMDRTVDGREYWMKT
jgi:hypothetical protein